MIYQVGNYGPPGKERAVFGLTLRGLGFLAVALTAALCIGVLSWATLKHQLRREAAAVVSARFDDCSTAEKLRARGRIRLAKEERELPIEARLLHVQLTPAIRERAEKGFAESHLQLAPVNCHRYAREAQP